MAEITLDLRTRPKGEAYRELAEHVDVVLDGISDPIAGMATISALIHHAFGYLWTGYPVVFFFFFFFFFFFLLLVQLMLDTFPPRSPKRPESGTESSSRTAVFLSHPRPFVRAHSQSQKTDLNRNRPVPG